jgi:hypothetical protein
MLHRMFWLFGEIVAIVFLMVLVVCEVFVFSVLQIWLRYLREVKGPQGQSQEIVQG